MGLALDSGTCRVRPAIGGAAIESTPNSPSTRMCSGTRRGDVCRESRVCIVIALSPFGLGVAYQLVWGTLSTFLRMNE